MITEQIDNILKQQLQKRIALTVRGRVIKRGMLWRFGYVSNYIEFDFLTPDGRDKVEIPIPYAIDTKTGIALFDYRFSTLADGDPETLSLLRAQTQVKDSKFYDSILTIDSYEN